MDSANDFQLDIPIINKKKLPDVIIGAEVLEHGV